MAAVLGRREEHSRPMREEKVTPEKANVAGVHSSQRRGVGVGAGKVGQARQHQTIEVL